MMLSQTQSKLTAALAIVLCLPIGKQEKQISHELFIYFWLSLQSDKQTPVQTVNTKFPRRSAGLSTGIRSRHDVRNNT